MPRPVCATRAVRVINYLRMVRDLTGPSDTINVVSAEVTRLWPSECGRSVRKFLRSAGIGRQASFQEAMSKVLRYSGIHDALPLPNYATLLHALASWRGYRASLQCSKIGVRNTCARSQGEILTLRDEYQFRRDFTRKRRLCK